MKRLFLLFCLCVSAFAQSASVALVRTKAISSTQTTAFYIASGFNGTVEVQVPFSVTYNNSDSASSIVTATQNAAVTALGTVGVTVTATDLAMPVVQRGTAALGWSDIWGKPTNYQADWSSTVINKPATFAPSAHTHVKADITDLGSPASVIASGTATFATTAIGSKLCSATVTVAATGVTSTDVIAWSYQADPAAATNAQLNMNFWPTANAVNFKRCNSTAASITPTAVVINWKVVR